eukprot:TRINITY_DN15819_c0_g1_i1.p1 TRINITY_DN15819_c0_g1~~TRINITY_DN15819_c0_g1_i1.p1  ORF type:complete len:738 (+),score=154.94 TRINITY_DN15819_c0_g1_i1:113-2215(+)
MADVPKYMAILANIANRATKSLEISLDEVLDFADDDFVTAIESNTLHYTSLFAEAADVLMPVPTVERGAEDQDVLDVLLAQLRAATTRNQQDGTALPTGNVYPPTLTRRYEVYILPRSKMIDKPRSVRSILAEDIGHLVVLKGIVTRVTNVRPLIKVATYTCEACGSEMFQEITGKSFTPIDACPSQTCRTNRTRGRLVLQTRGSRFQRVQELRIQERPDQVPVGHIPRSMNVMLRGELARTCLPGDKIDVGGIFLPQPYTGFRPRGVGLLADTFLEAMYVRPEKSRNAETDPHTPDLMARVEELAGQSNMYERLALSIAPEIFGHLDVKKALLLLLVAGSTKDTNDGMKIRGDINVCLMGDPGVAKSQLLRHIASIAPRGVYTSGRGTSGAGLTAAVMRDTNTGEMVLEGGALVLADKGVCCIDEFDKMQDHDRTAIHEVMEQQTVSIAKAGITTTLNARTAVLAAANPQYGRYNLRRSPAENINMPAALLSRFDLLFLVLDKPDITADLALAKHVLYVHQHLQHPPLDVEPLESSFMRAYINNARTKNPRVPQHLQDYIARAYVDLRKNDDRNFVVTARTLLCILRVAQALARLRFSDEVARVDVDEALRLLRMARFSLEQDGSAQRGGQRQDPITAIYNEIRDMADAQESGTIRVSDIRENVLMKGYNDNQIQQCLDEYQKINVWTIHEGRVAISFV